ncbi:MAG: hypothetical protein AAGA93_12925 [Actinomycetota bacterium]
MQGPVRRFFKRREMKHYNRLVWLVAVVNLVLAWRLVGGLDLARPASIDPTPAIDLVVANLTVAVLIRQQYVINALFWLATRAPTSWPLRVRWMLGKVYHFGGIHTSAATAATVWFLLHLVVLIAGAIDGNPRVGPVLLAANGLLAALLVAIVATALPFVRQKHHDRFERVHRLGGWSALALFWVVTLTPLLSGPAADPVALIGAWEVWALAAVTFSVALPWLRLKKVPVEIVSPSDHVALTRFDHGYTPFAGSSTGVSRNPLLEWHSFANVPEPGRDGFRLTISRSGDWTGSFIDDKPEHVWVKGIATAGVANIEVLFTKVVYVATGSGIGPCLPHLLAREVPAHLIWATRNPVTTYGQDLVDEILAVQPDALVWDTDANGKPDLVELAHEAVLATGAEAVICISNPALTWRVVEGMEQRGIPAYGAIWDS